MTTEGFGQHGPVEGLKTQRRQVFMPSWTIGYASDRALDKIFSNAEDADADMSLAKDAYILSHRVLHLTAELEILRETLADITSQRDGYARLSQEQRVRANTAETAAKELETKFGQARNALDVATQYIEDLRKSMAEDAVQNAVVKSELNVARGLIVRYELFLDDVGVQIGNYGIVDKDSFSLGRRYVETAGEEWLPFEPDGVPATDLAERRHKRKLIRQLAEAAGMKLGSKKKQMSKPKPKAGKKRKVTFDF